MLGSSPSDDSVAEPGLARGALGAWLRGGEARNGEGGAAISFMERNLSFYCSYLQSRFGGLTTSLEIGWSTVDLDLAASKRGEISRLGSSAVDMILARDGCDQGIWKV